MKTFPKTSRISISIPVLCLMAGGFCEGAVVYQVGAGLGASGIDQTTALNNATNFWTTKSINWTPLGNSTNEGPIKSATANNLDFVGDASNPGLYYANQDGYVFFRMRVYSPGFVGFEVNPGGSYMLLIDKDQDGSIDYGFGWDAKSKDNEGHGLEMNVIGTVASTWAGTKMDDLDPNPSTKEPVDINGDDGNGSYRTTDGYVRTDNAQSSVSGLATTFIDFAVSWDYLLTDGSSTGLGIDRDWNITAATIANSTDHGALDTDVMGADPGGVVNLASTAWSPVPEPTTALAGLLLGAGLLRRRRK